MTSTPAASETPVFERAVPSLSALPDEGLPEIALAGCSNVGKSSLINAVTRVKRLAKTSNTPGKTQTLNFYRFFGVRVVDLPGYGFASAPDAVRGAWSRLTDSYLEKRTVLAAVVILIDARHPAFPADRDMVDWVVQRGVPALVAATKSDKLKRGALAESLRRLRDELGLVRLQFEGVEDPLVAFSAVDGRGRREVQSFLKGFAP